MLGSVGVTGCLVCIENNIMHRGLHVHGVAITREQPLYLEEVVVLHALRTLHDWLQQTGQDQTELYRMTIRAGSYRVVGALQSWFQGGVLKLGSAAASPLANDVINIEGWLKANLYLRPFVPPESVESLDELPLFHLQLLTLFEEFRQIAIPILGHDWPKSLPRIPLTKPEIKKVIRTQWEKDEQLVLRQLSELGSVSSEIITRLELTREIVGLAMSALRRERAAQVTLLSILGATRFKTYFHGVLIPTRCPHTWGRVACGQEDTYQHLLICYKIQHLERKGAESLDFLITMARKARPARPGTVEPRFAVRERRQGERRESQGEARS